MTPKSKYYPLYKYLDKQENSGLIRLSFDEIEALLAKKLPDTAFATRAWWANSQTPQGNSWQEAGWLVDDVDFEGRIVVFRPDHIPHRVSPIRKPQGWSGEQIKALREFAGWTQQELANRLAVRQQTVSDWEVGHHTARRSMSKLLQMIAEEVGFPYDNEKPKSIR